MRGLFAIALLAAAPAAPVLAQGLPAKVSVDAGLAPDRLARVDAAFRDAVADGKIGGAVVFVARGGRIVDFEAIGWLDAEKKIPMPKDAIFRIASMTKAVTTVAALFLTQLIPALDYDLHRRFRTLVYQSIVGGLP